MAIAIKLCPFVVVLGLITLPFTTAETKVLQPQQRQTQYQEHDFQSPIDQKPAASERLFDLSSWVNRYPSYYYNRPYYPGGSYYPTRYPTTGSGYYPNYNQGYYPNYNTGYYPNTQFGYGAQGSGFGGGYGGYGGFGGNGGLTTYYGYDRNGYYGDRNIGFGYQQGTNQLGFSREGDRNLNSNSFPGYYY